MQIPAPNFIGIKLSDLINGERMPSIQWLVNIYQPNWTAHIFISIRKKVASYVWPWNCPESLNGINLQLFCFSDFMNFQFVKIWQERNFWLNFDISHWTSSTVLESLDLCLGKHLWFSDLNSVKNFSNLKDHLKTWLVSWKLTCTPFFSLPLLPLLCTFRTNSSLSLHYL